MTTITFKETTKKAKIPNAETLKAMKEAESKTNLIAIKDKADFYKQMNS
jgi:hypothetical protein